MVDIEIWKKVYALECFLHADDSVCHKNRSLDIKKRKVRKLQNEENSTFGFFFNFVNLALSFKDTTMTPLFQKAEN